MADVGVLQLKISADASSASKSLKTLQTRLSEISTIAQNFNMSNVSTQIGNIVKQVSSDKTVSTAVKNLGSLLNAIAAFSKVTKIGLSKAQIEQISALQTAVSGFNLGQSGTQLNKLREALGGEWNTEQAAKAREAIETLAGGTSALTANKTAEKIKEVSTSFEHMTSGSADIKKTTSDIIDYQKAVDEMGDTLKNAQVTFKEPLMSLNLQQFGGTPKFENVSVQNWRDSMNGIREVNDELKQTDTSSINSIGELQKTLADLGKLTGAEKLQRWADGIKAILTSAGKTGTSVQVINRIAGALKHLGEVSSGFTLPSFAKLESLARTLQENFNAENGLKRIADGISAFKQATQGLDLSNTKRISSIIKSMNETASESTGAVSAMSAYGESAKQASSDAVSNGFAESAKKIVEVEAAANETTGAISELIERLEAPIDYSKIQQYIDNTLGITSEAKDVITEANSALSVPAMEEDGPFKFASEEIVRYTGLLNKAKDDLAFWENEYASIQKRIKYNGITEDRTNALGQSEKGFYFNIALIEEYENRLKELQGYVSNYKKETDISKEMTTGTASPQLAVFKSIEEAAKAMGVSVEEAKRKLQETYKTVSSSPKGSQTFKSVEEAAKALGISVDETKRKLNETYNISYGMQQAGEAVGRTTKRVEDLRRVFADSSESVKRVIANIMGMEKSELFPENIIENIQQFGSEAEGTVKSVTDRIKELMFGSENLGDSTKKLFPTISGLLSKFKQLVKYRMLRAVIKQIADGFKEGYENYYHYSEAIGSGFAPAMDSAASSLLQMKNSIGAAVAPVLQSLVPVLQTVVSWFITAVNYANQFISLIRGQSTWSRATVQSAKAFEDTKKAAKGAGGAIKDLLADWDELNIIQSEGSGSGSGAGTKATADYASMFEEVSEFDAGVKELIKDIEEQFGGVLGIVKDIGAVLLGWKISRAFKGVLGTIGGLLAALGIVDLEFKISAVLNNKYLESGEMGYLVADVLKALVGGVLMKQVLSRVLEGQYAYLGIPLMLTVNATSRIITLLGNTDVDALSEKSIISSITSALEIGGVAGYLAYTSGATTGQAVAGGAVATILTLSALIGLKADVNAIKNGEITGDTIKAKALSALGLSIGMGAAAKLLVPGVSAAQAAGFGLITGTAATLVTLSATLGIVATCEAAKNEAITTDTVAKDAISSLLMGGGLAISAGVLGKVGAGAAMAFGGVGALVTLAALIGIQAMIVLAKEDQPIRWGDQRATENQIRDFVEAEMFTSDMHVNITAYSNTVKLGEGEDTKISEKISKLMPEVNALTAGIDTDKSIENIRSMIFDKGGLVDAYNEKYQSSIATVKAAINLVPIKDDKGNDLSAEYFKKVSSGWEQLNGVMQQLGRDLANEMVKANNAEMNSAARRIYENNVGILSRIMIDVNSAIASRHVTSESEKTFREGVENWDWDRQSYSDLMNYFNTQKDETTKQIEAAYQTYYDELDDLLVANQVLLEDAQKYGLSEIGGKTVEEIKDEIKKLNELRRVLDDNKNASVKAAEAFYASGNGYKLLHDAIMDHLDAELNAKDVEGQRGRAHLGQNVLYDYFNGLNDTTKETASTTLDNIVDQYLQNELGANYETIKAMIDAGIIEYSELIDKEFFTALRKQYGISDDYEDAWNELIAPYLQPKIAEEVETPDVETPQYTTEVNHETIVNETISREIEDTSTGMEEDPAVAEVQEIANGVSEAAATVNTLTLDDLTFNTTGAVDAAGNAASAIEDMARRIRTAFESLNGMSFSFNAGDQVLSGIIATVIPSIEQKASGGFVKSGDLVMANENGNFEMMGRMGNQPVVANNQQIVSGISQGVATANSGLESRLGTIENLLNRILRKEFTAKAVPSSAWGRNNQQSAEQYSAVRGY